MRINRWLDLLDRVGWTALQAAAGATIAALAGVGISWKAALVSVGAATLLAVCKVIVAQSTGKDQLGSLVPGNVIEHETVTRRR